MLLTKKRYDDLPMPTLLHLNHYLYRPLPMSTGHLRGISASSQSHPPPIETSYSYRDLHQRCPPSIFAALSSKVLPGNSGARNHDCPKPEIPEKVGFARNPPPSLSDTPNFIRGLHGEYLVSWGTSGPRDFRRIWSTWRP